MEKIKYSSWVLAIVSLIICGCGGGGSSSSEEQSAQSSLAPSSSSSSSLKTLSNSIEIDPILELGLEKGEKVCFRIKSYNNVTESDFSGAICSVLKNEKTLSLSWNDVPGDVIGYLVYYGTNKKNANNLLRDVIES